MALEEREKMEEYYILVELLISLATLSGHMLETKVISAGMYGVIEDWKFVPPFDISINPSCTWLNEQNTHQAVINLCFQIIK